MNSDTCMSVNSGHITLESSGMMLRVSNETTVLLKDKDDLCALSLHTIFTITPLQP